MGKVKLTQEQADVLEGVFTRVGSNVLIVSMHADEEVPWGQEEYAMNDFSLDTLIRALYIGYEVEQEFEAREWVRSYTGSMGKVDDEGAFVEWPDGSKSDVDSLKAMDTDIVRRATPEEVAKEKQRKWWDKHGRKVWELREHDILTHISAGGNYVVFDSSDETVMFYGGKGNRAIEDVKNNFSIKYFVEDRKDV